VDRFDERGQDGPDGGERPDIDAVASAADCDEPDGPITERIDGGFGCHERCARWMGPALLSVPVANAVAELFDATGASSLAEITRLLAVVPPAIIRILSLINRG
jgi:hypothetical protein